MTDLLLKKGVLRDLARLEQVSPHQACRIRASNDVEAMERWLDEYFDKPTTFKTYKKEGERFLVWCAVRECHLNRLNRDDVEAYIEFVKNPTPREVWCGPRRKKNGLDASWYPFLGPLSESAIITALASLNSMMSYLVDARYVDFNPFSLVRRKSRFKKKIEDRGHLIHDRILDDQEWRALLDTLDEESEHSVLDRAKKNRLTFLVMALFFLGLRIDELAHARWHDCKKINGKWWFMVRGKGDRLGKIPINSKLLHAMMIYRHSLELNPIPDESDVPLIHGLRDQRPLTQRQMSNLLKDLALKAAQKFAKDSPSYHKLAKLSPHWLRHLSASRQDLAGVSFTNIKHNLRHQNEQTTRIYIHAYDDERHREMEKLSL